MQDLISRTDLKQKIAVNRNAWIKVCSGKKHLMESVENVINTMDSYKPQDCTRCMISRPAREWISVEKATPKPLMLVEVRTSDDKIYLAEYNNGGWLYNHDVEGRIGHFFSKNPVKEWRVID